MKLTKISLLFFSCLAFTQGSSATNGYKSMGAGYRVGTAGAGAAQAMDATDPSVNPSLISFLDNQLSISLGIFHPDRYMDTSKAPIGNPAGKSVSRSKNFLDGSFGVKYALGEKWSFGFSVTGNGGMHTKYPNPRVNPGLLGGAYDTGVFYRIVNLNPTLAVKLMNDKLSLGVTPTISYSDVKTNTALPGPGNTFVQTSGGNKRDHVWGAGLKIGSTIKLHPKLTLGIAAQTPTFYQRFNKYKDAFISNFNFPATGVIGLAYMPTPNLSFLFDYEHLHYKGTKMLRKLPSEGGFGWGNMDVFKIAMLIDLKHTTLRLGYNYGASPIKNDRVFANVIAPAIVEHHIAAGITYKINPKNAVTLSGYFVPRKTQTESGSGDQFSQLGKGTRISMWQYGLQIGYQWKM